VWTAGFRVVACHHVIRKESTANRKGGRGCGPRGSTAGRPSHMPRLQVSRAGHRRSAQLGTIDLRHRRHVRMAADQRTLSAACPGDSNSPSAARSRMLRAFNDPRRPSCPSPGARAVALKAVTQSRCQRVVELITQQERFQYRQHADQRRGVTAWQWGLGVGS
jgi:hypothetical protein